jgi:hypothetical protein
MSAEFHIHAAAVACLPQTGENIGKINLTFPEEEVLMITPTHILDVHIPE